MFEQLTVLVFLGSAKDFARPRKNPVDVCKRKKRVSQINKQRTYLDVYQVWLSRLFIFIWSWSLILLFLVCLCSVLKRTLGTQCVNVIIYTHSADMVRQQDTTLTMSKKEQCKKY